jgi:hypothetical protein
LASAIAEGARLTARDHHVIELLGTHKTMTAEQLARFIYPNIDRARHRLHQLADRGVLARFRRFTPEAGSVPFIYMLGDLGAAIHAATHGEPLPKPNEVTERIVRLQHSRALHHHLGVVDFFTRLHAAAQRSPDTELIEWFNEYQAAAKCGDTLHPDGYGEWTEHNRLTTFFYEHDTGTEQLATLITKIDRYVAVAVADVARPVLFEVPNLTRERNLHRLIRTRYGPRGPAALVATTQRGYLIEPADPAGPIWWPAATDGHRRRLSSLDSFLGSAPSASGRPQLAESVYPAGGRREHP